MTDLRRLDCFYTQPNIARGCLQKLLVVADPNDYDLFVEPSAGTGVFLSILPHPRIGIDIIPTGNPEITQADFLAWQPALSQRDQKTMVVGNPPFGKNSSLAVKFFNHAAEFADCIALILPRTFRKPSVTNRLNRSFYPRLDWELPENSFEFDGQPCMVPAVFQVWVRYQTPRPLKSWPTTHKHFSFTTQEEAEFAVQRVGVNAGQVKFNFAAISPSSHYFIKAHHSSVAQVLQNLDWSSAKYDTAGNPSISKPELVSLYAAAVAQASQSSAINSAKLSLLCNPLSRVVAVLVRG